MTHEYQVGPGTDHKYVNDSLSLHMQNCTEYLYKLTKFQRYLVWRYTIGSQSVNMYMITGQFTENASFWTQLFFQFYFNTFGTRPINIPLDWRPHITYLQNPQLYINLSPEIKLAIARNVIGLYETDLAYIIRQAPVVQGSGFRVMKVSSAFPGLPDSITGEPIMINQTPFNSTSINPSFNFNMFLAENATCCLFDLWMGPGTHGLYIPRELHAYPFELEILLPPTQFVINSIHNTSINALPKSSANIVQVVDKIQMGPVYELNGTNPYKTNSIRQVNIKTYDSVLWD